VKQAARKAQYARIVPPPLDLDGAAGLVQNIERPSLATGTTPESDFAAGTES